MEKYFVTYPQALALRDLGFDEPCIAIYYSKDKSFSWHHHIDHTNNEPALESGEFNISAPLKSQVFDWFREQYNIQSAIKFNRKKYFFEIHFEKLANGENPPVMVWHLVDSWLGLNLKLFKTYEEAESACIDKLIEIIQHGR